MESTSRGESACAGKTKDGPTDAVGCTHDAPGLGAWGQGLGDATGPRHIACLQAYDECACTFPVYVLSSVAAPRRAGAPRFFGV